VSDASFAPRADASSPLAQELAVCEVEDEDTTSTVDLQELVGAVAAAANVEPHLAFVGIVWYRSAHVYRMSASKSRIIGTRTM
jgi:hypothetical protein